MPGPNGKHNSLDSYSGPAAPAPAGISGYLIVPPKQINAGDAKTGPKKAGNGRINNDSYSE